MESERKLSWILGLSRLSSHFSSPTPLLCLTSAQTPAASTLAPLQQLSAWFHSDATQTPLIIFFVISSCLLGESEAPSLTSTPTHLHNGHPAPALLKMFLWHRPRSRLHLFRRFSSFGQIGIDIGSALIRLWLHFGPESFSDSTPAVHRLLALTHLCS